MAIYYNLYKYNKINIVINKLKINLSECEENFLEFVFLVKDLTIEKLISSNERAILFFHAINLEAGKL